MQLIDLVTGQVRETGVHALFQAFPRLLQQHQGSRIITLQRGMDRQFDRDPQATTQCVGRLGDTTG